MRCNMQNGSGDRCVNQCYASRSICSVECCFERKCVPIESDGFQTIHPTVANPFVENDPISPNHYQGKGGLQVKDVIRAFELGFNLGNVVKYVLRAGKKDAKSQDLRKAREYIDFELDNLARGK